jgi:hypothetical protein
LSYGGSSFRELARVAIRSVDFKGTAIAYMAARHKMEAVEPQNLGMNRRGPERDRQHIRAAVHFVPWAALCLVLILGGCSRDSASRIHVELRDTPEANPPAQARHKLDPPLCPPGNHPPDDDAFSSPAGGHTVKLSWNPSTSSNGPNGKEISYCLYRTQEEPVQKSALGTTSPCVNCQRVTKEPFAGTSYQDTRVENGVHYCYVAIAIDNGTGKLSVFSSQTDAVIPPRKESPFCTPKGNPKQAPGTSRPGRR